jgi:hypothetical protein
MAKPRPRVAIAYDFDGTLAPGNMQERDFIPDVQATPSTFWQEVKALAREHDMDEILAYLQLMLQKADASGKRIDRSAFVQYGKTLEFFPGVEEWFGRINAYGRDLGLNISHYVISSGLREMIEGTSIAKHFKCIFASGFRYDQHQVAKWPALAVNYTNKAQYLFRINKGIENSWDNTTINCYMPEEDRPVPFRNMIYIGDGDTDIPAMKMTTYQGGKSIVVYPPRKRGARAKAMRLVQEERRADAAVMADYSENKALDLVVKASLDQISARCRFAAESEVAAR